MEADEPVAVQRLFFALMPPRDVAERIIARADALNLAGHCVASERLHLTLAFLGNVHTRDRDDLIQATNRIDADAFTLVLDRLGSFDVAGTSWLAPSSTPDLLRSLAAKLDKNTAHKVESGQYRAHVTVRRSAPTVHDTVIEPIEWAVGGFSLIASGEYGRPGAYRELGRWRLHACSDEPDGV